MTILTEVERATTLLYYERGRSYQEIVAELLVSRSVWDLIKKKDEKAVKDE